VPNNSTHTLAYKDDLITLYTRLDHSMLEIQDKSIHAVVTDPPYGLDFRSNSRVATKKFSHMRDDSHLIEWTHTFLWECHRILRTPGVLILFTRWDVYPAWKEYVESCGFLVKQVWIWDKGEAGGLGDLQGQLAPNHEWMLFCTKGRFKLNTYRRGDIFRFSKVPPGQRWHPISKPVPLLQEIIKVISEGYINPIIVDPYAGSCSTLMAAKILGIKCIGYDLPKDNEQNYAEKAALQLSQSVMTLL